MTGANVKSGFPPIRSVLRWTDPDGTSVVATAESYRPSGEFRVYQLRTDEGEAITAVMDLQPDTGALHLVATRGDQPVSVNPEVRHA